MGPFHDAPAPSASAPRINVDRGRTNIGYPAVYTVDQPIRIAFDRFLDPNGVTRQAVLLQTSGGILLTDELIAYDPVTLTVTLSDPGAPLPWLTVGQDYRVVLNVAGPGVGGLVAIDGAPLAYTTTLFFTAGAAPSPSPTPPAPKPASIDFCTEILGNIFGASASGCTNCHAPAAPLGLDLSTPAGVLATAIGQVADESNTGPRSQPATQLNGSPFGIDMPVITPGEPGNSWLVYKTLLAVPSAAPDSGVNAPTSPVSLDERTRLGDYVLGHAMPLPGGTTPPVNLTESQLESLSAWIAQGALVPPSCP